MEDKLKIYRRIDLVFLSGLSIGTEALSRYLGNRYSGAGFFLSFSLMITFISIYRWGKIGFITLMFSTLSHVLFGNIRHIGVLILYLAGSIFAFLLYLMFFEKIKTFLYDKKSVVATFTIYTFIVLLLRGILVGIFQGNTFDVIKLVLSQGLLSFVISLVVLKIIAKQGGVLINFEEVEKMNREEHKNEKNEHGVKKVDFRL